MNSQQENGEFIQMLSFPENPCIVYATKISNDTVDDSRHISSHNYIETIEYNL